MGSSKNEDERQLCADGCGQKTYTKERFEHCEADTLNQRNEKS